MNKNQTIQNWKKLARRYNQPSSTKSNWQFFSAVIPYFATWWLGFTTFQISPWLSLLIAAGSVAFLLRIFIIMHDCGHVSFYKSRFWCNTIGFICGALTFSPFHQWAKAHRTHHQNTGNLDKRGVGDVHLWTVTEFNKSSFWQKLYYRAMRSPFFLFLVAPFAVFVIKHRFTSAGDGRKEKVSVHGTNALILAYGLLISYFTGWAFFIFFQLATVVMTATVGIFLFYVQHQYKGAYWQKSKDWVFFDASVSGSSYLRLPKVLQWMTGNIGFHHIHHLYSSIPNYNLEKAYRENEFLQNCAELGLREAFGTLFLNLYDTKTNELISFRENRKRYGKLSTNLQ